MVTEPEEGDVLPLDDLEIEWKLDPEAESYWIEFDVETDAVAFNYTIPTSPVAAGVAAVSAEGNATETIVEVEIED